MGGGEDCVLALDQGTSSSRAMVFARDGEVLARAQRELPQSYPRAGWVEHDPLRIWQDQLACARDAAQAVGMQRIAALGVANQRETTLLWCRRTGEPLYPAIVWQDRRGEPLCEALRAQGLETEFRHRTGLRLDAYFSATKLRWLLDNLPDARRRALRGELAFGTVDSWLLWMLSGGAQEATRAQAVHATDVSNASRTLLWNLSQGCWDAELLRVLDIPPQLLPDVHPSSHVYARTAPGLFERELPIGALVGDQQGALFGQACFDPGLAKNTYGTGCFLLMQTGGRAHPSAHGLLSTAAAQLDANGGRQYAIEGSVFSAGSVVQWLRDGLHAVGSSAEIEALAASVPDSGGVVLVPAFTGLGAPYWRPDAAGSITGLRRDTTMAHIARAALESIAFQSAVLVQAMNADAMAAGAAPLRELRVDGGASANSLLLQFQADCLGLDVVRPQVLETTAQGAAWLAGLSCGVFAGLDQLRGLHREQRRFNPRLSRAQAQARLQEWEHAVRQTLAA